MTKSKVNVLMLVAAILIGVGGVEARERGTARLQAQSSDLIESVSLSGIVESVEPQIGRLTLVGGIVIDASEARIIRERGSSLSLGAVPPEASVVVHARDTGSVLKAKEIYISGEKIGVLFGYVDGIDYAEGTVEVGGQTVRLIDDSEFVETQYVQSVVKQNFTEIDDLEVGDLLNIEYSIVDGSLTAVSVEETLQYGEGVRFTTTITGHSYDGRVLYNTSQYGPIHFMPGTTTVFDSVPPGSVVEVSGVYANDAVAARSVSQYCEFLNPTFDKEYVLIERTSDSITVSIGAAETTTYAIEPWTRFERDPQPGDNVGLVLRGEGEDAYPSLVRKIFHEVKYYIDGSVESISDDLWVIDGHNVVINEDTVISSGISVGTQVVVFGRRSPEGEIRAVAIETFD